MEFLSIAHTFEIRELLLILFSGKVSRLNITVGPRAVQIDIWVESRARLLHPDEVKLGSS
jgi:hypothetical protein